MTTEEQRTKFLAMKPSALIREALLDVQECLTDKRYGVDMSFWHHRAQEKGDLCLVCMAGAHMAKSLGLPIDAKNQPLEDLVGTLGFTGADAQRARRRFEALDQIRTNHPAFALDSFGLMSFKRDWDPASFHITPWDEDRGEFIKDVELLADRLEKEGH